MKKLLFLLTLSAFAFISSDAQKANITGTIHFSEPVQMIYLSYSTGGDRVTDSTKPNNGKFHFTADVAEPTAAMLMVRFEPVAGQERPHVERTQLFMEPGNINIAVKDSLQLAKVSGSKSQKAFESLKKLEKPYSEKEETLSNKYREYYAAKDTAAMKSLEKEFDNLSKEKDEKVYHQYITQNPNSPLALYVLNQYAGYDLDAKKVEPLFNMLPAATRKLPSAVAFKERIETAKKTAVGAMAMDFTQNDTLDKPVSLSDFKGKYVLIDFWASWCGPCRAENPNVVKAYQQYKDKGFTILGISLDNNKDAWMKAIEHDQLSWTQVSDLKYWNNEVAQQYGIRSIPANLLLDKNGKIIARNLRGEDLVKKLAELMN